MIKVLKVTGQATLSEKPDTFIISFPLETLDYSYTNAINRLNEKVKAIRDLLKDIGLDPLIMKTSSFSIRRKTKWKSRSEEYIFLGYEASHDTSIELPIKSNLMNKILNELSEEMNEIDFQISFILKDAQAFKEELLKKAIANAKSTAEVIAKASGVKLQEIINIDYSFNQIEFIHSDTEVIIHQSRTSEPSQIEPEDVKEEKAVTITWAIESNEDKV